VLRRAVGDDLPEPAGQGSAQELVATLRQAVAAFTDGARPDDDRTVVVIKAR
jgi:serine phosphatase RsbU (regulator of sigma subunit)